MFKRKLERCTAVLLSLVLASSGLQTTAFAEDSTSTVVTETNKSVTWQEANAKYTDIVGKYNEGVTAFKTNSEKNILIDINTEYTEVVTMLDNVSSSLNAELTTMDYTKINATYVYAITTVRDKVISFQDKVSALKNTYASTSDNYSKLYDEESVIKTLDSMIREVIGVQLNAFVTSYEDNKLYSDEISVMLELDGGTYNSATEQTFKGYAGNTFILATPTKKGYIFKGWELVAGDCSFVYKNYTYTVTYGSKNSVLQAVWEYDGTTVLETEKPTETPVVTTEPTKQPIIRYIDVYIDLDGCVLNGASKIEKSIQESTTVILFDNVNLLQKEGYKVDSFTCKYGSCTVNPEGKVLYTSPSYSTANLDTIKVNWVVSENPTEDNKNIVTVNLDGGTYISTGKSTETYITNVNETSILFSLSDIKRDGYTLKSFECTDSANSAIYIQDGKVILVNTAYVSGGITLKAVWEVANSATVTPTQTPAGGNLATTAPTTVPTTAPTQAVATPTVAPTAVPTAEPTVVPTEVPTTAPTTAPTATPKPPTLKLSTNSVVIGKSEKVKITATTDSKDTVTWESEDNKVATVDSKGNIIGRTVGSTTVTVAVGTVKKKINVTVRLAPLKLGLNKSMKTKATWKLKKGKKKQIALYFSKGAYSNKITFKSSNKKIATVSSLGLIKAKKKGKVTITAKTYNNKKVTIKLTVTK